jgi:glycine cleavage system regulatory protein
MPRSGPLSSSLVLTVIGPDRPGLVESIADIVSDHDANWIESRMSHLAGQFAGLLRVSVAAERAAGLIAGLEALSAAGLRVQVESAEAASDRHAEHHVELELVGQDRPGIVREISRALAARGVNVEELETWCSSAPMSGETLFHARAALRLPSSGALDELRSALERLGDELMVDVSLDPKPGSAS